MQVTTTKTVNFDELFDALESFISITSKSIIIFLNLWIWMISLMNQTYFERYEYEFEVKLVCILIATCTYKSMLLLNEILLTHLNSKFYKCLWVEKKGSEQNSDMNWSLLLDAQDADMVTQVCIYRWAWDIP